MTFPTLTLASGNRNSVQEVKDAQWLLSGHNRYGTKFYTGAIDGVFGPATGAAAYRAKFWTGYAVKDCDHVFGSILYSYLLPLTSGEARKLPFLNRERRTYRLAHAPKPDKAALALALGETFKGYREKHGNDNMFGAYFGINHNPWCGCYVSYCYTKVGVKIFLPYVPNIVSWADKGENNLYRVYAPQPGDLVCFDWHGDGLYDHVEFVKNVAGSTINTLGGNTLPPGGTGDWSNGGGVYENARSTSTRHAFVRVKA